MSTLEMTKPKVRDWTVTTPYGIKWRPKFSSELAAWKRIANYHHNSGEMFEVCCARLAKLGWKVCYEPQS